MVPPVVDKFSQQEVVETLMWDKQDAYRTMAVNDEVFQAVMMDWILPLAKRVEVLEAKLNETK